MKKRINKAIKKSVPSKGSSDRLFSPSALKKNSDNIKLLTTHKEFKALIGKIRKTLRIPDNGFIGHDANEKISRWTSEMIQESDKLISDPTLLRQIQNIHEKKKTGEISQRMANKQSNLLHQKIPVNYLSSMIKFAIEKFNLPLHYEMAIRKYILTETLSVPCNNFEIQEYPEPGKPLKDRRCIGVKIYTKLTEKEFEDLKNTLNLFTENLPSYNPLNNIDRDLKIEEWLSDRMRFESTEMEPYKISVKEIAENILKNKKATKKVYEINRQVKELRTKRFGKK